MAQSWIDILDMTDEQLDEAIGPWIETIDKPEKRLSENDRRAIARWGLCDDDKPRNFGKE